MKMNKLLSLAAIVMSASVLNAGSYTWGFSTDSSLDPLGGGDEGYLNQGTALLFLGTIGQTDNGDSTYSLDLSGATFIASSGMNSDYTFGSLNDLSSSADVTGVTGLDYTLVLVYDDGVSDLSTYNGYYYLETGTSTRGYDPEAGTEWAQFISDAVVDTWSTAAAAPLPPEPPDPAPEPTSGLLVLLGVAGLALKRKRA